MLSFGEQDQVNALRGCSRFYISDSNNNRYIRSGHGEFRNERIAVVWSVRISWVDSIGNGTAEGEFMIVLQVIELYLFLQNR